MLKINSHEGNSLSFYKDIVNSKRNTVKKPHLKKELEEISDAQSDCFNMYDESFHSNRLALIEAEQYGANDKANLKALYNYRSKKIQELKSDLTTHPIYRDNILNVCQNCTINEVDTMDHVLAQTEFPEYSVHPKNLFPCCSVCNKKKSERFVNENGSRLFLNLYLDELPQSPYLHVDFGKNWLPHFWLEQPNDVADDIFNLIERHYLQLDLLSRFRDSSHETISTTRYTIRRFGKDRIRERVEEMCQDLEPVLGYNHRKVVLIRALGQSEEFIDECLR